MAADNMEVKSNPIKKELRILLLGKTSYENRVVRNILTGRRDDVYALIEKPETTTVKFENHGLQISVTDTPGLQDSEISLDEVKKNIEYVLKSKRYQSGFHAVLLVYRYPVRWTPEERQTFEVIKELVHPKNIASNGVVLMTNSKGLLSESSLSESSLHPEDLFEKYLEKERDVTTRGFSDVLSLVKKVYFLEYTSRDMVYKKQARDLVSSVSNNETFSLYQHSLILYIPLYWLETLFRSLYYVPLIGLYLYGKYTHWSGIKDEDVLVDLKSYDMLKDFQQEPADQLHMHEHGEEYIRDELEIV